jgi:hypothetical protein
MKISFGVPAKLFRGCKIVNGIDSAKACCEAAHHTGLDRHVELGVVNELTFELSACLQ